MLWRKARKIVSIKSNLVGKGLQINPRCTLEEESVEHVAPGHGRVGRHKLRYLMAGLQFMALKTLFHLEKTKQKYVGEVLATGGRIHRVGALDCAAVFSGETRTMMAVR